MSQTPRTAPHPEAGSFDARAFRNAMGRFATGVAVITTRSGDRDYGSTVSALASVSLNPPLLLCCFRNESETGAALKESGSFAVNLLDSRQESIARRFAVSAGDRFEGLTVTRSSSGLPLIEGGVAALVCRVANRVQAGDHVVVFGEVTSIRTSDQAPLVHFRGVFGSFQATDPA